MTAPSRPELSPLELARNVIATTIKPYGEDEDWLVELATALIAEHDRRVAVEAELAARPVQQHCATARVYTQEAVAYLDSQSTNYGETHRMIAWHLRQAHDWLWPMMPIKVSPPFDGRPPSDFAERDALRAKVEALEEELVGTRHNRDAGWDRATAAESKVEALTKLLAEACGLAVAGCTNVEPCSSCDRITAIRREAGLP